jgi:hypothetical protein
VAACGGSDSSGPGGGGGGTADWTVMVYMAADNSLATQGIFDIDEMEAAGADPDVNVVVQAEFSPDVLQQYQCDASCFNRPNFNTFRYAITGAGSTVTGPNGSATDIGNVDMTDPNQLKAFINYAKQNYPANHYLLVLWNHGGGYAGLIQDQTSAGSGLMSLDALKAGLTGVGPIDVVDFDMCLMAGYETLLKITGLTDYAVFSEEVVPGEGNPYTAVLNTLRGSSTMDGKTAAQMIVDQFHADYTNRNDKASTTLSAYDLAGFATFDQAIGTLATTLNGSIGTYGSDISAAAAGSQKYTYSELTDVVNFLDSLDARIGDPTVSGQIAAAKAAATSPTFRLKARARNGSGSGQQSPVDVSRSSGLNIVLPSMVGNDQFNTNGAQSLAAYQALYPGKPWTTLLASFVAGAGSGTTAVFDQGDLTRFESYLVWDQAAIAADADVDFWMLEPDGNIYIPAFGSVSPNGTMSNDSYADGVNFEGYLTNRVIQQGPYTIYANLWRDPANFQPIYDLAYRDNQTMNFSLFFGSGNEPTLSLTTSVLSDPTPTLAEADAGAYTDLQAVAVATFPAPGVPGSLRRPGRTGIASLRHPEITAAQMNAIRQFIATRRAAAGVTGAPRIGQPKPFGRGGAK